jgi:predicted membrane-bound spermidine synthase
MSTAVAPAPVSIPLPVGRLASVGAVIFAANAAMLVLQLVAGKLLAPFIGSSLETWTSIIGVFLVGIALGNGYGGKVADRYPTPRTLAILLAIGAVTALWMLVFPMLLGSNGAYKSLPLGPRIPILAAILCLPAGFVLSLLTPLAIKLGLPDVAHTGRVAGLIFSLSTLGCLIGNYVTGFYLIPTFTINALVVVSAGVLLILAAISLLMVKGQEPTPQPAPSREGEKDPGTSHSLPDPQNASDSPLPGGRGAGGVGSSGTNPHAFTDIRQAYLIVFLASFCGMTLELTASRVLAQAVGVSLFTWTGVIGVMLAGTALGNFSGGLLADWTARPNARFSPRVALASTLILAGATTVMMFVSMALITRFSPFDEWDPITQVMGWTFALFFLPMFMLGLVSPQVIRLSVPDVSHVGRVAGRVYAWSTAGAIVGTFAAGYFLLSTFGMHHTLLGVALVLTLISLLVVNIWSDAREAAKGGAATTGYNAGAGVLLYLFAIVLGGVTGGFILVNRKPGDDVVAQVESNYYTIKVSRRLTDEHGTPLDPRDERARRRYLNLDRLLHSVVDPDRPEYLYYTHEHIQMEFLWLAKATSPEPRTLVVGGGGYTFPRFAQEVMPESQIDVVEIDPKVTQVAYDHLGLSRDYKNLRPIHMDGRQFVAEKAAPGSYDLVIQDAVNDLSVPAHLMTKEYNDAVKATLKPGGVYLLTIIDSVAQGKLWKAAMATLKQTFPAENVVLLTDGALAPTGTPSGDHWNRQRHVMVIYASDKPFSWDAIQKAKPEPTMTLERLRDPITELTYSSNGFESAAVLYWLSLHVELGRRLEVHTHAVPAERLKPFTDRDPGVILTDQFCPIDNLMAEVFRRRNE